MLSIAVQSGGWAAATGPWSRRQRPVAGWPDAGARTHAKRVAQAQRRDADAERGLIAIAGSPKTIPTARNPPTPAELCERDRGLLANETAAGKPALARRSASFAQASGRNSR